MSRFVLFFVMLFSSITFADDDIYTGYFSNKAVSGYDTVSFYESGPVKGSSDYKTEYKGADWLFVNLKNLREFLADPEKYAPQYGGYCAWTIAVNDDFAPGDPEYWKIVDGKLYLNYDRDIQVKWEENISGFITLGDENWAKR